MPDLELRHLRYLIAVDDAGSITRAAEQLMITNPRCRGRCGFWSGRSAYPCWHAARGGPN
ncbi:hypothetical protein QF026_008211 [Streptomyces aurantiacus]|nr:LysR family transcriptional regulator [Streptomyces aurantiacus]MDQ0779745.1 hypothetical protein [Streptomyces aurantiacus]